MLRKLEVIVRAGQLFFNRLNSGGVGRRLAEKQSLGKNKKENERQKGLILQRPLKAH